MKPYIIPYIQQMKIVSELYSFKRRIISCIASLVTLLKLATAHMFVITPFKDMSCSPNLTDMYIAFRIYPDCYSLYFVFIYALFFSVGL